MVNNFLWSVLVHIGFSSLNLVERSGPHWIFKLKPIGLDFIDCIRVV